MGLAEELELGVATRLYIGGEWVAPLRSALDEVINPATEAIIGKVAVGGAAEVDQALSAAREAFDHGPWPRLSHEERAARMQALYDVLMRRAAEIQRIIVLEAGSTQSLAEALQFATPMAHAQWFIRAAMRRDWEQPLPLNVGTTMAGTRSLGGGVSRHEPLGVVAAVTAYNFPFFLNLAKVFPALLMGNTMVLKPSPYTPFEALVIAEAAHEAGLPKGVLNVVTGGAEVGQALSSDRRVDMVTFTGSDVVGAAIMQQAAPGLKRVHLELGGKSALIVRADADLQKAAMSGLVNFTLHCGQGCGLNTRHLVHNSVRPAYIEMVKAMVAHVKVGDPADPATGMGPLIRESQRARVERYVESGLASGARLVCGGKRPEHLKKGFFFEPTLFDGVDNRSDIARHEIFGPVACVTGFDSDEEAIAMANDSDFGLGGTIFSADTGAAYDMACQLRTGTVMINGGPAAMNSAAPMGGYKRSGIGREYGVDGLLAYTEQKSIVFPVG